MAQTSLMHLLKGIYTWHMIFILLRDILDCVVTISVLTHALAGPCKSKKLHVFHITVIVLKAMQSERIVEVDVIHQEIILLWFLIWRSKFRVPSRGCICVLCCVSSSEELF